MERWRSTPALDPSSLTIEEARPGLVFHNMLERISTGRTDDPISLVQLIDPSRFFQTGLCPGHPPSNPFKKGICRCHFNGV